MQHGQLFGNRNERALRIGNHASTALLSLLIITIFYAEVADFISGRTCGELGAKVSKDITVRLFLVMSALRLGAQNA